MKMNTQTKIETLLRSGTPALAITTSEQDRFQLLMEPVISNLRKKSDYEFIMYQQIVGASAPLLGEAPDAHDLASMFNYIFNNEDRNGVYMLVNSQLEMGGAGDHDQVEKELVALLLATVRKCRSDQRDVLNKDGSVKRKGICKHIIFVGVRHCLPPELEKEINPLKFGLPETDELGAVVDNVAASAGITLTTGEREHLINAVRGLTLHQAADALAFSYVSNKKFIPAEIAYEKARQFEASGLITLKFPTRNLDSIAGYDQAKAWINSRNMHMSPLARARGLPHLKGILDVGPPGTGKTCLAEAVAAHWGLPMVILDWGSLFGKYVGESEQRLRDVIAIVEALAPCLIVIDEIDKSMASGGGGHESSETNGKVMATFMTWMGSKTCPAIPFCTANDLAALARVSDGALLRKGRFDVIIYTDLPNVEEREAIWKLKLHEALVKNRTEEERINYEDVGIDVDMLAEETNGWTGAEIEACIHDAGWMALAEGSDVDMSYITRSKKALVPLSEMKGKEFSANREWAKKNCLLASSPLDAEVSLPNNSARVGGRAINAA